MMCYLHHSKKAVSSVIDHFIAAGINVNHKDTMGWTAFHFAVNNNFSSEDKPINLKVLERLIEGGADPKTTN